MSRANDRTLPIGTDVIAAISARHVLASLLLSAAVVLYFWPTARTTDPSFAAKCDVLDRTASESLAQLLMERDELIVARLDDAVFRLRQTGRSCQSGSLRRSAG